MNRYQIGRITSRWTSFVPPIQGGHFRPWVGDGKDDEDLPKPELGEKKTEGENRAGCEKRTENGKSAEGETTKEWSWKDATPSAAAAADARGMGFLDTQTHLETELTLKKYPSLDEDTQAEIMAKYHVLYRQIKAEGLDQCNYTAYAWEAGRCSLIFATMLYFLRSGWYCTSAVLLGVFWSQLVFAGHDAGHMAITQNYLVDTLIAMTIAAPIGGLSMGWWKKSHNIHHVVTNAPEHDPDNQHLPFLAVNHRFLGSLWSTYHQRFMPYDAMAKALVPIQAYLYYPILMFGRFNLYVQSLLFLLQGQGPRKGAAWWHRWYELAGICIFWYWFAYLLVYRLIPTGWDRFVFVMISHMVTMPLHVQFTISHFAMSTADLGAGESFAQKMLRTTMDVDCPEWLDWFHGGLQFQAIHHLYPRIPRHNLRRVQKMVMEFCKDVGIPYALYGFARGNAKVLGSLAEVSRQAAILAQCQRVIAERGDLLHDDHH